MITITKDALFDRKIDIATEGLDCNSAEIQGLENSDRSYQDLSLEFQKLYPSAMRAFELIPLMYNRLTLVDKLSHKEALTKICDDHKHLSGFSPRNIRRYLPSDNQVTHRRVRPPRPKKNAYTLFISNDGFLSALSKYAEDSLALPILLSILFH